MNDLTESPISEEKESNEELPCWIIDQLEFLCKLHIEQNDGQKPSKKIIDKYIERLVRISKNYE